MIPTKNCILCRLALAFVLATLALQPSQVFGSASHPLLVVSHSSSVGRLNNLISSDYGFYEFNKYAIPCSKNGDLLERSLTKSLVNWVAVRFAALKVEQVVAPDPVISGKKMVCPNEEVIYSTPSVNGSIWEWTLISGGTITQVTNNTVKIKWNNQPGTINHKLSVKESNGLGESKTVDYFISIKDITLRCIGSFNISVDNTCKTTLTTEMILAGAHVGSNEMKLQLLAGTTILEEGIGSIYLDGISKNGTAYDLIDKTYGYKITELCTNNVCSGSIKFEDQSPPMVEAPRDTILGCAQVGQGSTPAAQDTGIPRVTDCSTTSFTFSDQVFETSCTQPYTVLPSGVPTDHTLPTTHDIVKIIVRTFTVTDKWNNQSDAKQLIFVRKGKIEQVICPPDVEYNCKDVQTPLTPAITGYPLLDLDGNFATTNDRYPVNQSSCQLSVTYKDDTFHLCLGSYRVVRAWVIFDWCAVDNPLTPFDERRKECSQVISVLDKTPPSVSATFSQYYVENNGLVKWDTVITFNGYSIQSGNNVESISSIIYPLSSSNSCTGLVRLTVTADDKSCSKSQVNFTVSDVRMKLLSGYPQFDPLTQKTVAIYEGNFNDIGDYSFQIEAKDVCGFALAKQRFQVNVRDNINPQIVCGKNAQTALGSTGASRVYAASFDGGSSDNCSLDRLEVRRINNCGNPADTVFKPYVEFSCCDVNKNIAVILRGYDKAGNYSDCSSSIFINDNTRPTCIAPAEKSVICTDVNWANLKVYGEPNLYDNCTIKDTVYTVEKTLSYCNIGTITRKWVISDLTNKKDSCSQIIRVTGKSDFTVDFPDDIVADCLEAVPTLEQVRNTMLTNPPTVDGHIVQNACGSMAVEVKDDTLTGAAGICYLILRRIKVIDWCKYNQNTTSDPNCYGLPVCGDVHSNALWQTQNADAWQYLARPSCNPQMSTKERRFRDADGLVAASNDPLNPVSQNAFSDGIICFTQTIRILDLTPPQFISSLNDTVINAANCNGTVNLTAKAQDPCTGIRVGNNGLRYTWKIVDKTKVDTLVLQGTGNTINTSLELNQNFIIYWSVSDACGNTSFKKHTLKVACVLDQQATLSGVLKTETGKIVPYVTMTAYANGSPFSSANTAATGGFSLNNLTVGQKYVVKASRNDNPLNGVSTFDIALISRHILGIAPFTSPYQIIAADVNRDGEVSAADMLILRRLILRSTKTLPNGESWRFIPKNYVFQNPEEPFSEDFPEIISLSNMPVAAQTDFVAMKVGDVNGTVQPSTFTGTGAGGSGETKNLIFEVENKDLKKGETYKILFKTRHTKTIGFQFTLNFTEGVELKTIQKEDLKDVSDNNFEKFGNAVTASWNGTMAQDSVNVFSMTFIAKANGRLSDVLTIGSNITTAEAFDKEGTETGIDLVFKNSDKTLENTVKTLENVIAKNEATEGGNFTLYQNEPNPFQTETKISFNLPTEAQATLTIYDLNGRVLKTLKKHWAKGYNEIQVQREELNATGILFYRLETATQAVVKKMILIN
jgi:Dockerin type I domain/Secretion system C-terminal sorting domain